MMLPMPLNWVKFFSPSSSSCHLSVFDTMVPLWQVLMVQSLLSQMLERVGTHRQGFSDNVENLREVVRSILTFCGERFESLPLLWVVHTAYRCLKDQVQEQKCLPPEDLIQSTLLSNPISGAAGTAEVGTLDELGWAVARIERHCTMTWGPPSGLPRALILYHLRWSKQCYSFRTPMPSFMF